MQTWIIILIVLIVSTFLLIRFSARIVYKLLGLFLILPALFLILYALNLGPFETNYLSLNIMRSQFCNESSSDSLDQGVCECIVLPHQTLLQSILTDEEIEALNQNKGQSAYMFISLYPELKRLVLDCTHGDSSRMDVLFNHFTRNSIPLYKQSIKGIESLVAFYTSLKFFTSDSFSYQGRIDSLKQETLYPRM